MSHSFVVLHAPAKRFSKSHGIFVVSIKHNFSIFLMVMLLLCIPLFTLECKTCLFQFQFAFLNGELTFSRRMQCFGPDLKVCSHALPSCNAITEVSTRTSSNKQQATVAFLLLIVCLSSMQTDREREQNSELPATHTKCSHFSWPHDHDHALLTCQHKAQPLPGTHDGHVPRHLCLHLIRHEACPAPFEE